MEGNISRIWTRGMRKPQRDINHHRPFNKGFCHSRPGSRVGNLQELTGQRSVFSQNLKPQSQTLLFMGRVEPAQPFPGSCQKGRFSAALSGRGGHGLGKGRGSLCFKSHRPGQGAVTPTRLLSIPLLLQGRPNSRFRTVLRRAGLQPHHRSGHPALNSFLAASCSAFNTDGCRLTGYAPLPFLATQGSGRRLQDELPPKRLCACVVPPKPRPFPAAPPSYPGLCR